MEKLKVINLAKSYDSQLNSTFIYVTHDQTEALSLATKIMVLRDGVIQQIGTPQEIYDSPNNQFVAQFIGVPAMNLFHDVECNRIEHGNTERFYRKDICRRNGKNGNTVETQA